MRVAYLVVSHRNSAQVLRLVGALREGGPAEIAVRHDERHSRLDPEALAAAGGRALEDGIDVEWGRHSHLRMLLGAIGRIRRERDPDWLVVISGQDYPLRPLAEIEERLAESTDHAYLGAPWKLEGRGRLEFFRRYAYRHARIPRRLPHPPAKLAPLIYRRDLPNGTALLGVRNRRPPRNCWVSADWPILGRRALTALVDASRDTRLMRHYRGSVSPAESFFATVLMNEPGLRVSGDDRRYLRFAPGAPSPDVLTSADLDELIASGAHFARKFDASVDAAVLDALDEHRRSAEPR